MPKKWFRGNCDKLELASGNRVDCISVYYLQSLGKAYTGA